MHVIRFNVIALSISELFQMGISGWITDTVQIPWKFQSRFCSETAKKLPLKILLSWKFLHENSSWHFILWRHKWTVKYLPQMKATTCDRPWNECVLHDTINFGRPNNNFCKNTSLEGQAHCVAQISSTDEQIQTKLQCTCMQRHAVNKERTPTERAVIPILHWNWEHVWQNNISGL